MIGSFSSPSAQRLTIEVDGGVSQPIGIAMDHWKTGVDLGANLFLWPVRRIGIGLRFGYDRWIPDRLKFTMGDSLRNPEVKGSTSIFEIIPSARLATAYKTNPINFFGQVGTGIYAIRATSHATGPVSGVPSDIQIDNGTWIGRWGFQIGPGISIAAARHVTIEVFPLYNGILNGDHLFQYFVVNAGVSLKF